MRDSRTDGAVPAPSSWRGTQQEHDQRGLTGFTVAVDASRPHPRRALICLQAHAQGPWAGAQQMASPGARCAARPPRCGALSSLVPAPPGPESTLCTACTPSDAGPRRQRGRKGREKRAGAAELAARHTRAFSPWPRPLAARAVSERASVSAIPRPSSPCPRPPPPTPGRFPSRTAPPRHLHGRAVPWLC